MPLLSAVGISGLQAGEDVKRLSIKPSRRSRAWAALRTRPLWPPIDRAGATADILRGVQGGGNGERDEKSIAV